MGCKFSKEFQSGSYTRMFSLSQQAMNICLLDVANAVFTSAASYSIQMPQSPHSILLAAAACNQCWCARRMVCTTKTMHCAI